MWAVKSPNSTKGISNVMISRRELRRMRFLQKLKKTFLQNRNNVNTDMLKDITIEEANVESMADLEIFRLNTLALMKFGSQAND